MIDNFIDWLMYPLGFSLGVAIYIVLGALFVFVLEMFNL